MLGGCFGGAWEMLGPFRRALEHDAEGQIDPPTDRETTFALLRLLSEPITVFEGNVLLLSLSIFLNQYFCS